MQKHFALFFLSAVFAYVAHAAEDLTTMSDLKKEVGSALDNARKPAMMKHKADNAACPYANDNLLYAIPGSTAAKLWREDGHVRLPANAVSTENGLTSQSITMKGGGVKFAHDAGNREATHIDLTYDDIGGLKQLKISKGLVIHHAQTIDYAQGPEGCELKRVTQNAPSLGGVTAVSFDANLCRQLKEKQLLDPKTIEACGDYNAKVNKAITAFDESLPPNERFEVFTSNSAGGVTLKPFSAKSFGAAGAALANDCLASWHGGTSGGAAADEGVERGSKSVSPTAL